MDEQRDVKPSKQAIAMGMKLAKRKMMAKGGVCMSHGGSCDGNHNEMNPKLEESYLAQGSEKEPEYFSQGGGVDDFDMEELEEADEDGTDLVYSPEEFGKTGFGEADNQDDDDESKKRNKFLMGYVTHRSMHR